MKNKPLRNAQAAGLVIAHYLLDCVTLPRGTKAPWFLLGDTFPARDAHSTRRGVPVTRWAKAEPEARPVTHCETIPPGTPGAPPPLAGAGGLTGLPRPSSRFLDARLGRGALGLERGERGSCLSSRRSLDRRSPLTGSASVL